ncbi:MAG: polysaccharide biosynthesis/export family protein [Deltaproteobacteria bacterium]|nr:polysaccharide biosynthesis/export family protein [Deltaproteobacteria bacterium]
MKTAKILFLILAALCVSGCSTRGTTKPRSQVISDAQSKGVPVLSVEEDRALFFEADTTNQNRLVNLIKRRSESTGHDDTYRIGPRDELEINVFDVPELNVTARVRESGFVSLPLLGAVKAAGLTESEFHDEVRKRLSGYVKQPELTVFISMYGSQKVAVMGAVARPGTYPLKKGSNSILELISEAGGVNEKAGNYISFIPAELSGISAGNDVESRAKLALATQPAAQLKESGIQVYLDQVMGTNGGIPLEIPVRGGDMVIVPEGGKVMVEGEVQKVGQYDLGQQMTMLGAIAAAGGITYGAKVDEVEIEREVGIDQKAHLVLDLGKIASGEERDVRLRNGDIVRVPSDSGRRLTQDTFESITRIFNVGAGVSLGH